MPTEETLVEHLLAREVEMGKKWVQIAALSRCPPDQVAMNLSKCEAIAREALGWLPSERTKLVS